MAFVQIGDTLIYRLSQYDVQRFAQGNRLSREHGNPLNIGDELPLIVAKVWPHEFGEGVPGVNGQVILDGPETLWVTSVQEGNRPGTWRFREQIQHHR